MRLKRSLLLASCCFGLCMGAAEAQSDCSFSRYNATEISDLPADFIAKRVEPDYPVEARTKRLSGTVLIRVLVDKQGKVFRTCPVSEGISEQPHRSLVEAAETAAKKFQFRKNFGQPDEVKFRFKYLRYTLTFRFEQPHKPG
jgi:TonB family protein